MIKPKIIFLATPAQGTVSVTYVSTLFNLLLQNKDGKYHFDWGINSTGSIAISRDILAQMALNNKDCAGILWNDTDMKWAPADAFRILDHNKDIVGATYARKQVNTRWVMTGLEGKAIDPETGLLEVKEIGTGFLYTSRAVLEAMQTLSRLEYQALDHTGKMAPMWNFFFQGVIGGRFYGEDYGFCYHARQLGFQIYADTKCVIPHTGSIDFPLPNERTPKETAPNPDRKEAVA